MANRRKKAKAKTRAARPRPRAKTARPSPRSAPEFAPAPRQVPADFGDFEGPVQAQWLDDGRNMFLLKEHVFHQRKTGQVWTAPTQTLTDGASIPQPFWSVIGGPFEGKYRDAAVNHDYECCAKVHPWRAVHRMFYDGMRASGVEPWLAGLMYFAVYFFGPRWPAAERVPRPDYREGDIARAAAWLQRNPDTSLEEIEAQTPDHLRETVRGKPRAIKGSDCLSDDRRLTPVERDGSCLEPLPVRPEA